MIRSRMIANSGRTKTRAAFTGIATLAIGTLAYGAVFGSAHAAITSAASYTASKVIAADSFNRSVNGGLGNADVGGAYTTNAGGTTTVKVANGAATVSGLAHGHSAYGFLPAVSGTDVEVQSTVQVGTINSSRLGLYLTSELRRQANGDAYAPRIIIGSNGAVNLGATVLHNGKETRLGETTADVKLASNQKLDVQWRIVGSSPVTILGRAWIDGTSAPAWKTVATDNSASAIKSPGSIGFWAYESTSGTVQPFSLSKIEAWSLVAPVAITTTTTAKPKPTTTTTVKQATTTTTTAKPVSQPASSNPVGTAGLDESGNTIPDTNYPIPSGAVFLATNGSDNNSGSISSPVATLSHAVAVVPNNGTIVVRGGTYRQGAVNTGKPLTLQPYPHEKVWFDGTDVIPAGNWASDGNSHWSMAWSTPTFCNNGYYSASPTAQGTNGPCAHYDASLDPSNPLASDPQMVFVNGAYAHEAASLAAATNGAFYYDWSAKRIYISTNPANASIEVAARAQALMVTGAGTKILGVGFTRYATNEFTNVSSAALYVGGANSLIENDVFSRMAGGGFTAGAVGGVVNRVVSANNGFTGMGSNGHQHSSGIHDGITIENSIFNGNNTEMFDTSCSYSCAAGGVKIAHMDGYTMKDNIFENTHGHSTGAWCDLACTDGVFINNLVRNNGSNGYLYEVSDRGIIANNTFINNTDTNLRVDAANTQIYNNTISGGNVGMWIYDDPRQFGVDGWTDVGPEATNVTLGNNVISGAGAFSIWVGAPHTAAGPVVAAMDYDSFSQTANNNLFVKWPTSATASEYANSISAIRSDTGFETHGTAATSDVAAASGTGGPIPANVAALIGKSTAAGQAKGALK